MFLTTDTSTWRVLIVDDEPDNLNLASDVLGFCGAETAQAGDGQLALNALDTFNPNLILIDLQMPVMDGWELHRELRSRAELKLVPMVALTALAMPADAERVKAAGFDGYITKPFRVRVLQEMLNKCIEDFARAHADAPQTTTSTPL